MKPSRFDREADAEFTVALHYYTDLSQEPGTRFYGEIEALIAEDLCAAVAFPTA